MADFASMLYGTAQNAAQNEGSGLAQSFKAGSELGLQKQQLDMQSLHQNAQLAQSAQELDLKQQEMQKQMQMLTMEKYSRVGQSWEAAAKMTPGPLQQAFVKSWIPTQTEAMGIQDSIDPTVMDMMQKDPATGAVLMAGVLSGKYDPGVLTQPDQVAKLYPELQTVASAQDISRVAMTQNQELLKGYQESLQRQNTQTTVDKRIAEQDKIAANREAAARAKTDTAGSKEEQAFRNKISDKVDSDFKPLLDAKTHINSALNAGDRVAADLAAGKKPHSSDQTLLATGLATTISKRINPTEFQNIMHERGAASWTIDQWQKYIAGGANPEVIQALMAAAKSQDAQLDQQIDANKARLEAQVGSSKWADKSDSILSPLTATLGAIPKQGGATISFNGKQWTPKALKAVIDANPNDPKAAAARAALNGG